MGKQSSELIILAVLATMDLFIPSLSAVFPGANGGGPIITAPDLNITGSDIANQSIPCRYGLTPTMIDVRVEITDTSLPGPKGEMAAGPRTIGFSADPLMLAILVVAVAAAAVGMWYTAGRNRGEHDKEDE